MELGSDKGAFTWLTALPLQERASLSPNKNSMMHYVSGIEESAKPMYLRFCVFHWSCNDLLTWRPNHSHADIMMYMYITANDVCRNIEPPLLPLTGKNIMPLSANRREDVTADIHVTDFWGCQQCAFFDVRVFHSNAQSYHHSSISNEERILRKNWRSLQSEAWVERLHCFASMLQIEYPKGRTPCMYSKTMAWIRCTLSFSLAVMCIRSSHSASHRVPNTSLELGVAESQLTLSFRQHMYACILSLKFICTF